MIFVKLNDLRGKKGGLSKCLAIALASSPIVLGLTAPAAAQQAGQFAEAIANLAAQFRAEIARIPKTSAIEEYEAAILFLADQSGQPVNVVCAAMDEVKLDATTPNNARAAMTNVCRSIRNRRGTGAIGNSGPGFGAPSFSAPVVSLGGGSSTYSQ